MRALDVATRHSGLPGRRDLVFLSMRNRATGELMPDVIGESSRDIKLRRCGTFNGISEYLPFPVEVVLNGEFSTLASITRSANTGFIFSGGTGSGGVELYADTISSNSVLSLFIGGTKRIAGNTVIIAGAPVVIEVKRGADSVVRMIVNGVEQSQTYTTNEQLKISVIARRAGGGFYFAGEVWDFVVSDGSGTKLAYLGPCATSATVATWFDRSGNNHHAIPTINNLSGHIKERVQYGSDALNLDGWTLNTISYSINAIIPALLSGVSDALGNQLQYPGRAKYNLTVTGDAVSFPLCGQLYDIEQEYGGNVFYDNTNSFASYSRTIAEWAALRQVNVDRIFAASKGFFISSAKQAEEPLKKIWRYLFSSGGDFTGVTNYEASLYVLKLASFERIALCGIGDSNQLKQGHGWTGGFNKILSSTQAGLWGLPWMPMGGFGAFASAGVNVASSGGAMAQSGAPVEFSSMWGVCGALYNYAYLASGSQGATYYGNTALIGGPNQQIRHRFVYGEYPGWAGDFTPLIRDNVDYNIIHIDTQHTTGGTAAQLVEGTHTADCTGENVNIAGYTGNPFTTSVTGPFFGLMQTMEAPSRSHGFQYSTLGALGGYPAKAMLQELSTFGPTAIGTYLTHVRNQIGTNKIVVVAINEGMNDRGDTSPSIGPIGGFASNTKDGFKDNIQGIVNLVRSAYTLKGWSQSQLFFILTPAHPMEVEQDYKLDPFRQACDELAAADGQIISVRTDQLTNYDEMLENGWYDGTWSGNTFNLIGTPHLTDPTQSGARECGYDALARLQISAMNGRRSL